MGCAVWGVAHAMLEGREEGVLGLGGVGEGMGGGLKWAWCGGRRLEDLSRLRMKRDGAWRSRVGKVLKGAGGIEYRGRRWNRSGSEVERCGVSEGEEMVGWWVGKVLVERDDEERWRGFSGKRKTGVGGVKLHVEGTGGRGWRGAGMGGKEEEGAMTEAVEHEPWR